MLELGLEDERASDQDIHYSAREKGTEEEQMGTSGFKQLFTSRLFQRQKKFKIDSVLPALWAVSG